MSKEFILEIMIGVVIMSVIWNIKTFYIQSKCLKQTQKIECLK